MFHVNIIMTDLLWALEEAVAQVQKPTFSTANFHERVREMYSWQKIAERTEVVYAESKKKVLVKDDNYLPVLEKYYACGLVYGKILCVLFVLELYLLYFIKRFWRPASEIDIAPDFDRKTYKEIAKEYIL